MPSPGTDLDAHVVNSDDYAILVLIGRVTPGSENLLRTVLLESEKRDHGHVIADVRQVTEMSREAVKVLLWELGRAFDDRRTLRLVVRDVYQKRFLDSLGLAGMLPTHASLEEAMAAVDVIERPRLPRVVDLTDREDPMRAAPRHGAAGGS